MTAEQHEQKVHISWKSKNLMGDKNINSVKQTGRYSGKSGETEAKKCACLDINSENLLEAMNKEG